MAKPNLDETLKAADECVLTAASASREVEKMLAAWERMVALGIYTAKPGVAELKSAIVSLRVIAATMSEAREKAKAKKGAGRLQ